MWVVLSTRLFVTVFELSKYGGENVRFCFCSFSFSFSSLFWKEFFFIVSFSMCAINPISWLFVPFVQNWYLLIYLLDLIFHCKRCKTQYLWFINLFMAILKLTLSFRYVFASVRFFSQQTVWEWDMSAILKMHFQPCALLVLFFCWFSRILNIKSVAFIKCIQSILLFPFYLSFFFSIFWWFRIAGAEKWR